MATKAKANEAATEEQTLTEGQEENNQAVEKDPADEIKAIKDEMAELKALLKAGLAQMVQTTSKPVEGPGENVVETLGEAADTDAGTEWDEYMEVIVPRHGKGQEKYFYVCVNDRSVQVPADGKRHKMRKPHAEVLLASLEAEADAENFADSVPHAAAPESYEQLVSQLADLKAKLKSFGIE